MQYDPYKQPLMAGMGLPADPKMLEAMALYGLGPKPIMPQSVQALGPKPIMQGSAPSMMPQGVDPSMGVKPQGTKDPNALGQGSMSEGLAGLADMFKSPPPPGAPGVNVGGGGVSPQFTQLLMQMLAPQAMQAPGLGQLLRG